MLEFDKKNFEEEVLNADGYVLVDYWSPKCEPCMELMPQVTELAEKYGEQIKFGKLNIVENRRLAISQKVLGLPTIILYKGGEKVWELSKDFTIEDLEGKIKETL
ncbi:thioredoxin family protein [Proteinivorax tanatarense]|uniref:Thioredoxin n=1 Tax=Proteinivorax tanatarense TaxID=1260629 RepID=A0AAU7VLD5_9FIRM